MGKRIKWVAVTLAVAAVLAIGVGATVASAATPTPTANTGACGGAGGGWRFGGGVVDEAVTKLLDMTADEIRAVRQEGKSLADIAAAKDIEVPELVDAIMEYKTAQVQSRVAAGTITQDQASVMLQQMEQATTQAVTRTSTGPVGGQGKGMGRGAGGTCSGTGTRAQTGAGQGQMNRWAR